MQIMEHDMVRTEVFGQDGRYGLMRGSEVILPPEHRSIGPFVGGYALVDGEFFVDASGCPYRWRSSRRSECERPAELIPGGFGKIITEQGRELYLDFVTDLLWTCRPEDFVCIDFLHFFALGGLFYLRVPGLDSPVAFRADDLWLRGDVFQRRNACPDGGKTIFMHRAMPATVFDFCGFTADRFKRLRPLNGGDTYYYMYRRGGVKPVRTRERILPVDTEERREMMAEAACQERDIQCALRMKRLWGKSGQWL